ncbi:MAG TPA: hypothetical protein VMT19_00010 [Thermoanaerobaculaceae bacterium]|nr:hypothetical protein [Thermoanaerobaculaceae bacterium]
MLSLLLLAVAPALPPVIADPRGGPSDWQQVRADAPLPPPGAAGYLLVLPAAPEDLGQAWLDAAVALAARRAPVVAMGAAPPPAGVVPYLDGFAPDPAPAELADLAGRAGGLPLVVAAADAAAAVADLAAGAAAVLLPRPDPAWAPELAGLLPDPEPARAGAAELPTAMRSGDLATVIGIPAGFAGGDVVVPGSWHGAARLVAGGTRAVAVARRGDGTSVALPALAGGGILVVARPAGPGSAFERVEVSGERLPSAAEVLARHQRAAARQERLVLRWRAHQRLLVRVWVAQLSRSFEVALAGPAFWEHGVGTDWEIARAWVDGVAWDPDHLPDLPLLEPKRASAPPLALRLEPSYRYELTGVEQRAGRRCYALTFEDARPGRPARRGTAYIDAATFGLVELAESAEALPGEVRATHSVTTYAPLERAGETLWFPATVTADDLLSVFGGGATVHRELALTDLVPDPPRFVADRAGAYARDHRMLRDAPAGIVPLVPDGRGGRVPGSARQVRQQFLIAGAAYDPGYSIPIPFGGLQLQDFDFRGRGEQLRLLVAGVVNDAAWSKRSGTFDLSLRGFVQLLPFSNALYSAGVEEKEQAVKTLRQSVGAGLAASFGVVRMLLDLGVNRLDFSRDDTTASGFVLPSGTFEPTVRLQGDAALGAVTATLAGEAGRRATWRAWGIDAGERPEREWRRAQLLVVYEKALFPLAKLHLDAEAWTGSHLDRFSAPSPSRFGGVRIRGIASDRVLPERLGVLRASLALPLSPTVRVEAGVDAGWVRDIAGQYRARPLSGAGASFTVPGPWATLMQGSVGFPLATPGPRRPTVELFLLRPLVYSK